MQVEMGSCLSRLGRYLRHNDIDPPGRQDDIDPPGSPLSESSSSSEDQANNDASEGKSDIPQERKEPTVIEENFQGVRTVVGMHETRRTSEEQEAKQFDRWRQERTERNRQEREALELQCESRGLSPAEKDQFLRQYKQMKQAEAEVKVYEGYMRNACCTVEVTTDTPHGPRTEQVVIPKARGKVADKVVLFAVPQKH